MEACKEFSATVADMEKFCNEETGLRFILDTTIYPIQIRFKPIAVQQSIFERYVEGGGENEQLGSIDISIGISTKVKSTLNFRMEADLLKKLIRKAEKIGVLYFQAFRERAGELFENSKRITDSCITELWKVGSPSDKCVAIFNRSEFEKIMNGAHESLINLNFNK